MANVTADAVASGINTEISIGKTQSEIYQRFVNLSVNEEALAQGDGTIRISPFDDYILFTLYDELDNVNKPVDLSNVGKLYISFIGTNDEIKIPYWTNVEELDLSQGQVLFRISSSDSKKILALDNNNFYISTQMVSENGDPSDESVIYTGKFLSFSEDATESMTSKYNELLDTSSAEVATLTVKLDAANAEIGELKENVSDLEDQITVLNASNIELTNVLAELDKEVTSDAITLALANSRAAQAQSSKTVKTKRKKSWFGKQKNIFAQIKALQQNTI